MTTLELFLIAVIVIVAFNYFLPNKTPARRVYIVHIGEAFVDQAFRSKRDAKDWAARNKHIHRDIGKPEIVEYRN